MPDSNGSYDRKITFVVFHQEISKMTRKHVYAEKDHLGL
jgi:hypothetical protein